MLYRLIKHLRKNGSDKRNRPTNAAKQLSGNHVDGDASWDMDRVSRAMEVAREYVWDLDLQSGRLYLAPRITEVLGCDLDSLPISLDGWKEWIHRGDIAGLDSALQRYIHGIAPIFEHNYRVLDALGNTRMIESRGVAIRNSNGKLWRLVGTHCDVTRMRHMEQRLSMLEHTQDTLRSIGDGILTTDAHGCITDMNPIAEKITGWCARDARGLPMSTVMPLYHEVTRVLLECPVDQCIERKVLVQISEHALLINRNGQEIAIADSTSPITDAHGHITGVIMVFHDETERRKQTKEMSYQLTHEALTGLISRREFERRLDGLIADATLNDHEHALLYLDLDQFKIVNDTNGHVAGDELLRQVATLLQAQMRRDDTLARIGGDEFAALMEHCPSEHALRIAEKLRTAISGFRFNWQSKVCVVGATIGVVLIDKDSHFTVASAISAADMTCYEAKDGGRNRVQLFQESLNSTAHGKETHSQILTNIRIALTEDRFELYGQRILPLSHDVEDHYEVLLRMPDQFGNLMSPAVFIPVAERYGLMPDIDRWVVRHAIEALAQYRHREKPIGLSINLSGLSFTESMLAFIKNEIARTGVAPHALCFEITETAALGHLNQGTDFMHALKEEGCRFALDDFGVGMSSFTYLKALPVSVVKIDGSFVKDMLSDIDSNAFVKAINNLGQITGRETVAEYVESLPILKELMMLGVDHAQGYAIGKPSPLSSLLDDEYPINIGDLLATETIAGGNDVRVS